jgi:hypothetical protein
MYAVFVVYCAVSPEGLALRDTIRGQSPRFRAGNGAVSRAAGGLAQQTKEQEGQENRVAVIQLPEHLFLHFNRYRQLKKGLGKLGGKFDFPDVLCMDPVMVASEVGPDGKLVNPPVSAKDFKRKDGQHMYRLRGVTVHTGDSVDSGHYRHWEWSEGNKRDDKGRWCPPRLMYVLLTTSVFVGRSMTTQKLFPIYRGNGWQPTLALERMHLMLLVRNIVCRCISSGCLADMVRYQRIQDQMEVDASVRDQHASGSSSDSNNSSSSAKPGVTFREPLVSP